MPKNVMIAGFKETRQTVLPLYSDDQFRIGSPNKKSKKKIQKEFQSRSG